MDFTVGKSLEGTAPFAGLIPLGRSLVADFADQVIPGQDGTGQFINPGNGQVFIDEGQAGIESGQDDLQPLSFIIWLLLCLLVA